MTSRLLSQAALAVVSLAGAASAHSAVVNYTSLASFNANAGATTVETFSSANVGVSTAGYNGSFTGFSISSTPNGDLSGIATGGIAAYGDDTTTGTSSFYGQKFYGWGNASSGANNGSVAPTTLFSTALGGVTAIGFDFFNTDYSDSYSVWINGSAVATISTLGTGFLGFVGTAGTLINTLEIRTSGYGGYISTAGIDNVRVAVSAVPEPASLALVGLALAAGGLSMRRKPR